MEEIVVRRPTWLFFLAHLHFLIFAIAFSILPFFYPKVLLAWIVAFLFAGGAAIRFLNWRNDAIILRQDSVEINIMELPSYRRINARFPYHAITGITSEKQGLLGLLFNYGSLTLNVMGEPEPILIAPIPKPEEIAQTIRERQREAR